MATEQIQKVTVSICEDVWHVHVRDKLAACQQFTNIYLLYLLKNEWILNKIKEIVAERVQKTLKFFKTHMNVGLKEIQINNKE